MAHGAWRIGSTVLSVKVFGAREGGGGGGGGIVQGGGVEIGINGRIRFALFLSSHGLVYPIDDKVVTFHTIRAASQGDKTNIQKQQIPTFVPFHPTRIGNPLLYCHTGICRRVQTSLESLGRGAYDTMPGYGFDCLGPTTEEE